MPCLEGLESIFPLPMSCCNPILARSKRASVVVEGGVKVAGRWGEGAEVEVAIDVDATAEEGRAGGDGYLICTPGGIVGADERGWER